MDELKIVYLRPENLTPYENNARKHAKEDIDVIKASIQENGFCDPIGIWGDKNIIVEGHGRRGVLPPAPFLCLRIKRESHRRPQCT